MLVDIGKNWGTYSVATDVLKDTGDGLAQATKEDQTTRNP
jgi:hypothetical protein